MELWSRVLAPNPGPMTLEGTNTWVLGAGSGPAVVVDPGPDDEGHLDAVASACPDGVATIVLTHHHHDHVEGVAGLVQRTGAQVRAVRHDLCTGPVLRDGDRLDVPAGTLEVLLVPGHTSDSLALLLDDPAGTVLLSGDTVLGRGTTVIAHPDGHLQDYLDSLRRLQQVVRERKVVRVLPGHGPEVERPAEVLAEYLRHRLDRLEQVRSARAGGASTAEEVVAAVYGPLEPVLHGAALRSVRAQLQHLDSDG
ncbi:MBL fold metallo-hydrolase [Auraticoccus monumenti]|uniref:Glyoxylase, beta-lactamase superfamily II n=1 Tax=Auraticoccus monumenti TaxID=675864 RepID=A0A1G6S2L7_9ACTN|nr:MBL fold metallo-hydrolase [Auraticoccus monumenti]SDD11162.1 Glyoxylase, beta-lactamase superfamily II [Auraticoccus monumenti]